MSDRKFTPFVPANVIQSEFTLRALLIGLGMCVMLGAANAYLGLRAGMTIAATYPAAVIGMALLRIGKGNPGSQKIISCDHPLFIEIGHVPGVSG